MLFRGDLIAFFLYYSAKRDHYWWVEHVNESRDGKIGHSIPKRMQECDHSRKKGYKTHEDILPDAYLSSKDLITA